MGLVLALAPQFCPALRFVRQRDYRIRVGMRLVGLVESVGLKLELKLVSAPAPQSGPAPRCVSTRFCYVRPAHDWFFVHVWYWVDFTLVLDRPRYWIVHGTGSVWYGIDFTLLAFVPFVVVLTGNCVMVTCVVRAVRFRYRQEAHPAGARTSGGSGGGGGAVAGDKGKAMTSSTIMLMTLSVDAATTTTLATSSED